jgi:hypothetical protein
MARYKAIRYYSRKYRCYRWGVYDLETPNEFGDDKTKVFVVDTAKEARAKEKELNKAVQDG